MQRHGVSCLFLKWFYMQGSTKLENHVAWAQWRLKSPITRFKKRFNGNDTEPVDVKSKCVPTIVIFISLISYTGLLRPLDVIRRCGPQLTLVQVTCITSGHCKNVVTMLLHCKSSRCEQNSAKFESKYHFVFQGNSFENIITVVILFIPQYVRRVFSSPSHLMGPLPDTSNCGLRMRRECRERFPRHRGLAIQTCITARASRTCRDACQGRSLAVSFEVGGRENVPGIPGACATHNVTYLARGPWHQACHGYTYCCDVLAACHV